MSHVPHNLPYLWRLSVLVLTLTGLLTLLQSPVRAQEEQDAPQAPTVTPITQFSMTGEEGDYIGGPTNYFYRSSDSSIVGYAGDNTEDGIIDSVSFNISSNDGNHWWSLDLSTATLNKNLLPGFYGNGQRWPFADPGHPGLSIYGDGRGCNMLTGNFTVHEAKFDYSDPNNVKILNFAATFEQHCEGGPAALIGTIYYKYTGSKSIYSISGHLANSQGAALSGARVEINGSKIATTTTDSAGNYRFSSLLSGGNYRIVPKPNAFYVYKPVSRKFLKLGGNLVGNFTAVPIYKINGRVTNANGAGLSNAYVTLSGSKEDTVLTDSRGYYSLPGLRADGTYTVTVAKQYYGFTPPSQTFRTLSGNQTLNFKGNLLKFVIGGQLVDRFGVGIKGVTVTLNGTQTATTITDSAGRYQFKDLVAGGNYIIMPSQTNYDFDPPSQYYYDLRGSWNAANFTGIMRTYTLSGQVFDGSANGVGGITVKLTGTRSGTVITDSSGGFTFIDLPAGGNYTVTPSQTGYSFSPPNRAYTNLSNSQGGINFIASH